MEPPNSSKRSSDEGPTHNSQKIQLNVLSPSVGVPNKLSFADIPTSTTVGKLKEMICARASSNPSPAKQRLIYRGRPLVREEMKLVDVFTQDTVSWTDYLRRSR